MSDIVSTVENALFNRMFWNAAKGFLKSAAIAGIIGAAIGAALFGFGILSQGLLSTGIVESCLGSQALAGAVIGAVTFMLPAGAFGATAGINAARDARRFLLSGEAGDHSLMPKDIDLPQAMVKQLADNKQTGKNYASAGVDWRQKLESEPPVPHQLS